MTFERWMDRQYGKNWGVTMASIANRMKDAYLAGRSSAFREAEKESEERARDAASQARHEERHPEEPYGTF